MSFEAFATDSSSIEATIGRRFRTLRFTPELEQRFEADCSEARCRRMVLQNLIGLATYEVFMIGDIRLVGDVFRLSFFVHVGLMMPLLFLVNIVVSRQPSVFVREGLAALTVVVTVAAILLLMLVSRSPLRDAEHFSVVLVILFATLIQRIRFWYVLVACLASLILYISALSQVTPFSWDRALEADAVLSGVVIFSLIGCYTLEHERRLTYLLGLRDRLRNAELEAISRFDPLTLVGNRRALDDVLARLDARPDDCMTAILLIDVDRFKTFNDVNGHQAGDVCLKHIAGLIAAGLRAGNGSVFRFGGEEFLVLLPLTALETAVKIGERIRVGVAAAIIPSGDDQAIVTISVGVAAGVVSDTLKTSDLIADADNALYAAKQAGRNRVCPVSDNDVHGRRVGSWKAA